jgi:iron(III) transport system permease protein
VALAHSLLLAVVAGFAAVVLGGLVALLERGSAHRLAGPTLALAYALPGSVLAVGILVGYGRWLAGLGLILLAYVAKLWAFGHRPVAAGLERVRTDSLHAARASGAGARTTFSTVVLPPLAPALLVAFSAVFVAALHEVTMSSLLYGPGSETLAVVVLDQQELGQVGQTAALSVLLAVLVVVLATVAWVGARAMAAARGRVLVVDGGLRDDL